jgi:hypothetical protein
MLRGLISPDTLCPASDGSWRPSIKRPASSHFSSDPAFLQSEEGEEDVPEISERRRRTRRRRRRRAGGMWMDNGRMDEGLANVGARHARIGWN